jgi:ABC-2 type transport system permease protein
VTRLRAAARHVFAIAARELGAFVRSPVAWVVLVLFLVVQGFSFWAVLEVLADPKRPAPYGAVLRTHFGGTFLHWSFLLFVVSALTMRLVAEERRTGTWETLCAAPVSDGEIVVGKWLGALGFYALLWLPTLLYPVILRALAPPGAAPDSGPIATAYLGVLVVGASFLAVGVAASAATASQVVAAVAGFVALLALLMLGLLPETAPTWFSAGSLASRLAAAVDVRRHMDDFARGLVDTRHLAVHAGLAISALVAATMLCGAGRRARRQTGAAVLGALLVAAAALLANVEVARHPARLDATRARVYTLEKRTRQILADVRQPVTALVLAGSAPEYHELYDEILVLLRRFQAEQPLLAVEEVDPALDPGRITELAQTYELTEDEIAQGGAVVFLSGDRHRGVALSDMAELAPESEGGRVRSFRGEQAFAAALLDVTDETRPEICFASGHGEPPIVPRPSGQDLSAVVHALERDGAHASDLADLAAGVPARCAALAIVGPTRPIAPAEALALDAWLAHGGRLLVAVDPDLPPGATEIAPTGLETLLPAWGVRLGPGVVVDPERQIRIALSWITDDGYGDHPIVAGFDGRRVSYWFAPRWIAPADAPGVKSVALVSSTPNGFAETSLGGLRTGPPRQDGKDEAGPVAVAVAAEKPDARARLVVFGSARTFSSEVVDRGLGSSDLLFASSIAWLTDRTKLVGVGAKTPEQIRLSLGAGQARRLFFVCVAGWPLLWAAAGLVVWRRRRTR